MTTKAAEAVRGAAELAERRIKSNYRDTLGEWPDLTVERTLLAIIADPSLLISEMTWLESRWNEAPAVETQTGVGWYIVRPYGGGGYCWQLCGAGGKTEKCDSIESGKAAAFADFRERARGMFRT
jgi:hypothetical protein